MKITPTVSVVTPVFNTAAYLPQCIESVLGQSFGDFEYLIVDNGSTDESFEIAETYARKDERIRIVRTSRHLPQAGNYNFSLRQISGESVFCKIVQADDFVLPDCLSAMVRLARTDPDIVIVGAYQLAGSRVKCQGLPCHDSRDLTSIVDGRIACRLYLLEHRYLFGTPTSVLYRADLVRNRDPFFDESSYHEDSEVCFDVLEGKKFGFVHQVLTYTRVDNVSISTVVQHLNPDILHAYIITKKFGPRYLSSSEFEECRKHTDANYYNMLAASVFHRHCTDFWAYHRKGLELAGERLNVLRIVRLQMGRILNWLGNPKNTMEKFVRKPKRSPQVNADVSQASPFTW